MTVCPGENEANSELTNLLKIVHCSLSFHWAPFRVLERMSHRTDSKASLSNGAHLLSPQHLEMWIWICYECCKSYEWLSLNFFLDPKKLGDKCSHVTVLCTDFAPGYICPLSLCPNLVDFFISLLQDTYFDNYNNFRGNQIDNVLISQRNE